jgi:hypothetical protein
MSAMPPAALDGTANNPWNPGPVAYVRVLCAATVAAILAVAVQLPWSSWAGTSLSLLLFLPITIASALLVTLAVQRTRVALLCQSRTLQSVIVFASSMLFLLGAYAANAVFLDPPWRGYTLWGYAGSAFFSTALAMSAMRFFAFSWSNLRLAKLDILAAFSIYAFVLGSIVGVIDATFLVRGYESIHVALGATSLVLFSISTSLFFLLKVHTQASIRFNATGLAITVSVALVVVAAQGPTALSMQLVRSPTAGRRALQLVRRWLDADGDGYSAYLGGGDCDDHDVRAFPLSTIGRDCAGILGSQNSTTKANKSLPNEVTDQRPPRVIVLLTIDAFRCGFGNLERPELGDICPTLTLMAKEGMSRLDAHAAYPSTQGSIASLHTTSNVQSAAQSLPQALSEIGFRTAAVSTYQGIVAPSVQQSYTAFDESLVPLARSATEPTSSAVTEKLLALVANALASDGRHFIWGHYFDPHATYIKIPGSPIAYDRIESYVSEIRRTDAAIGRLLQTIRNKAEGAEVVVMVTADHGEEFGEHGGEQHAATLFEESTRIPFVAWRSGAAHSANLPKHLPAGHAEMGPFILSVARGQGFLSTDVAVMNVASPQDRQIGVYSDGWKFVYHQTLAYPELFNLKTDPSERTDLSESKPAKLEAMKRLLADQQPTLLSL